jgi:hypothetical protein
MTSGPSRTGARGTGGSSSRGGDGLLKAIIKTVLETVLVSPRIGVVLGIGS